MATQFKKAWACEHTNRLHMSRGLCGPCYDRTRYGENRDSIREKRRMDRINNPEKYKKREKAYRARNRRKLRAENRVRKRLQYSANPELFIQRAKAYYCGHKEEKREYDLKYRERQDTRRKLAVIYKNYKINEDDLLYLFERQNFSCCCGRVFDDIFPLRKRRIWAIDHDHKCCPKDKCCGKCVRGLLCSRCNLVIGLLEENPRLLPAFMIEYLDAYENIRRQEAA